MRCTGAFLALNSYENRVYQVCIEDDEPLIAKFYRPLRWTTNALLEEHEFALALQAYEIPVVAPLPSADGATLHEYSGFQFALYPRRGGRAPALDDPSVREWIGRFLGRLHALGRSQRFFHRPTLTLADYVERGLAYVREHEMVPADVKASYFLAAEEALELTREKLAQYAYVSKIRLHGDCHASNILWTDAGPHFVDLDDCRNGPAVQDIWMLLSGDREEQTAQLADLMRGYTQFCDFDASELGLIEALRTMRILYYTGWLAQRWTDPAFPKNFPWFAAPRYWEEQIYILREQYDALHEPALDWKWS